MVGTNSLNSGGTRYNLEKILVHEQYNKPALAYDISLIRVQRDIQFNAKVKSIELEKTQVPAGTELVATGWGLLSVTKMVFNVKNNQLKKLYFQYPYGKSPIHLQMIRLNAISNQECKQKLEKVHETHLCTFKAYGEGMCRVRNH